MIHLTQLTAHPTEHQWRILWRLHNPDSIPLTVESAWLPHSRFRSQEWPLQPPPTIAPGAEAELPSTVAWREPPGTVVENAFLILRTTTGRLFARLTVTAGPDGEPRAVCQAVTAG